MRAVKKIIYALPQLLLLVVLVFLLFFIQKTRVQSAENDNTSLILRLTQNKQTGQITIDRSLKVRNSALRVYPPVKPSESTHRLEVFANGVNIYNVPLRFIDKIHSVPPLPRTDEIFGSPPLSLPNPTAIITIPYQSNMTLRVRDFNRNEYHYLNIKPPGAENGQDTSDGDPKGFLRGGGNQSPPPSDGYFDILFVSSHYSDRTKFFADANSMGNFLLTVAPYSDLKSKIRIQRLFTTENLNCGYDTFITRLITCDEMKVFQVASSTPYDTIVVVENNNKY